MAQVVVVVPAFRAKDTITRAIGSLLAQSFTDWQAVVVADDGCDYCACLARAGINDSRLVFAGTGRVAAGPSAARNVGLAATSSPLIAPLDADDGFAPDRLARLVPLALAAGAAFDNVAVLSEPDGPPDGPPLATLFPTDRALPGRLTSAAFLATSVPMFPVCRREAAGLWDEGLRFAEDVVFNLRLLEHLGPLPLCPAPLYRYTIRPNSLTASPDSAAYADRGYAVLLSRLASDGGGLGLRDPTLRAAFATRLAGKRALNQAFAASGAASFQEFLAGRSPGAGGESRPAGAESPAESGLQTSNRL